MTPLSVFYSFPHVLGRPGIGTTAYNQVIGLVEQGCEVHLSCTTLGRPIEGLASLQETLRVGGRRIPHRALAGTDNAYRYHDFRASRRLATLRNVNVAHVWPAGCLITLRAATALGVPALREAPNAHTAQTFASAEAASASVGVRLPRKHSHAYSAARLSRELAEFDAAAAILAPSEYVRRSFLAQGYPAQRVIIHQYGYDPQVFHARNDERAAGGFTALFVGRGDPTKGLHHALEAWRQAERPNDARLLVCGRIEPSYRQRIAKKLDQASVQQLGFLSDVGSVMRAADVLVHPSLTEGSALVIYEAMACGVIPLVSDAAGAPVQDGEGILIHRAGDERKLRSQLQQLLDDVDRRADLRRQALKRAENLTWADAARRLEGAYREALERQVHGFG